MHRARAHVQQLERYLCRVTRQDPILNLAISTILAQGSAIKQCRPLVQNRRDFELGLCFSIGRSMNEDFLWWVDEK